MAPENQHYIRCLETLKESAIFGNLDTLSLQSILRDMAREKWKINTFYDTSDFHKELYFIISGRLKVYQLNPQTRREHTIFILSEGDIFDVLTLLDTDIHQVYWETLDPLEVLCISVEKFRNHLDNYPILNKEVFIYLGKRMRLLENATSDICLHNTLTRLAKLLLKYINEESQQLELIDNLPNDEIASLIGTTRAVVNRHLQQLKKAGAISTKRKHIDVQNIQTLINIAEEKVLK